MTVGMKEALDAVRSVKSWRKEKETFNLKENLQQKACLK